MNHITPRDETAVRSWVDVAKVHWGDTILPTQQPYEGAGYWVGIAQSSQGKSYLLCR